MLLKNYIAHETTRQSGTMVEALGMYDAYRRMVKWNYKGLRSAPRESLEELILQMVRLINGSEYYRRVPVYFALGGHAMNYSSVPRAMQSLCGLMETAPDWEADALVKEFLDIHPFVDGNGRVASILWNWLNGTLIDPDPLPKFYGAA